LNPKSFFVILRYELDQGLQFEECLTLIMKSSGWLLQGKRWR